MAKKSIIERQKRRENSVAKYAAIRKGLKSTGDYEELKKLPRDSSPTRLRNRDVIDGRARGYMRKFSISRITFRKLAHAGHIPGVKKASW